MSEVEKKDESDESSNDGVFIFLVSWAIAFSGASLSGYHLKESVAISPILGLIGSFVFVAIRGAVRKILKK
jgi:hypothetical protein